ncbi:MAG: hypothetical protein OXH22_06110 [Chloroflexi bacterium]|nr:hypothetical protein [Chloroflexota bacterium]
MLDDTLMHAVEQLLIVEIESNDAIAEGTDIDTARCQGILLEIQNNIDEVHVEVEQELTGAS